MRMVRKEEEEKENCEIRAVGIFFYDSWRKSCKLEHNNFTNLNFIERTRSYGWIWYSWEYVRIFFDGKFHLFMIIKQFLHYFPSFFFG